MVILEGLDELFVAMLAPHCLFQSLIRHEVCSGHRLWLDNLLDLLIVIMFLEGWELRFSFASWLGNLLDLMEGRELRFPLASSFSLFDPHYLDRGMLIIDRVQGQGRDYFWQI